MADDNGPKRSEGAQQSEDAQDAEDLGTVLGRERDDDVEQRDEDEAAVHHVPTTPQVRVTTQHETLRYHLHDKQLGRHANNGLKRSRDSSRPIRIHTAELSSLHYSRVLPHSC